MKAHIKSKAVISFIITVCILCRGFMPVFAKSPANSGAKDSDTYVVVCGIPVGIRLRSHGVIITGFMGFTTENNEYISPAKEAGLREGDRIVGINGHSVEGIDDMQGAIDSCSDTKIIVVAENSQGKFAKEVKLYRDVETNELRLGIWGRDSVSGIGTLTFYNEKTKTYGALGHAISDGGQPYCISGGSLKKAEITGIKKGVAGSPGELRGYLRDNEPEAGDVDVNCDRGIFGHIENIDFVGNPKDFCRLAVAGNREIHKGSAYILSSAVDGKITKYSIDITQVNRENESDNKNFTIKVTDKRLLDATGGIVQGMSGSPVVQDGKLVGAVTHVLINNPALGYGIFIENMLESANTVAEEQQMKEAS